MALKSTEHDEYCMFLFGEPSPVSDHTDTNTEVVELAIQPI